MALIFAVRTLSGPWQPVLPSADEADLVDQVAFTYTPAAGSPGAGSPLAGQELVAYVARGEGPPGGFRYGVTERGVYGTAAVCELLGDPSDPAHPDPGFGPLRV